MIGEDWRVPVPPAPFGLFGLTDAADVAWLSTMVSDQSALCLREPVAMDNPALSRIPRTHATAR